MKKALVLGVLAIFAIGIANVNAQDRTNVQEKPKKPYQNESTSKVRPDTKAINADGKISDPTAKNVTPSSKKVQGTKGGNKVGKSKEMKDIEKKNTNASSISATGKDKKAAETVESVESTGGVGADRTATPTTSKNKPNSSVPPTKPAKRAEKGEKGAAIK